MTTCSPPARPSSARFSTRSKGEVRRRIYARGLNVCWATGAGDVSATAVDWAERMRELVDHHPRYADVEQITVVFDNLNTHDLGSLYVAFPPSVAKRIA